MGQIFFIILTIFFSGCGLKTSSSGEHGGTIISGLIPSLLSSQSVYNKTSSNFTTLSACVAKANLFKLETDGSINELNSLASTDIGSDARYLFNTKELNLSDKNETVNYLVKIDTCSGESLKRPVTGFDSNQDVNAKTTVIAEVINTNSMIPKKLNESKKLDIETLINSLSGSTTSAALNSLTSNAAASTQFLQIFGASSSVLRDAKPEVVLSTPFNINELSTSAYTINSFHIDPNYSFAYSWKLDGVVKSQAATWNFIPNANSSGTHQIDVYIGKDDGTGSIDLTKPYYAKTFNISINNNILPVGPDVVLNSTTPTPRNINNIKVDLATGVALSNCASFSHLAVTDSNLIPGVMQFNIDCSTAGTQTENITFSNSDGAKTLYLWAMDNEGQISNPKTVNLVLDTAAPIATISFSDTVLKGGNSYNVTLSASDAGSGLNTVKLYFTNDGTTYNLVSTISNSVANAGTIYSWTAPVTDTVNAKLKLIATDLTGLSTTVYSNIFTIDSTAPTAPVLTRTSSSISNNPIVSLSVSGCGGDATQIYFSESSTAPLASDVNWQACASSKNFTVSIGNGLKNIYAFTKDSVDNVSLVSAAALFTLDQANPVASISSQPNSINNLSTANFSFSGTDTGGGSVSYYQCSIDGAAFSNCSSPKVYSSLSVGNHNFSVTATDTAGNTSTAVAYAWMIDQTPPTVLITANPTSLNNLTTASFSFSGTDTGGGSVSYYQCSIDGAAFSNCSSPKVYSSLSVGNHNFSVTATDTAGNISTAATYAWTIDLTAPVVAITSPSSNGNIILASSLASYSASGTCSENGVLVQFSGVSTGTTNCSAGVWSYTIDLTSQIDGTLNLIASQTDSAGNTGSSSACTFIKDTVAPAVGITAIPINPSKGGSTQNITWTATDTNIQTNPISIFYSIDNGATWVSIASNIANTGTYAWTLPTVDSSQSKIKITSIDLAGNSTTAISGGFVIDSTAPTFTPSQFTINSGATSTFNNSFQMGLQASDALSNVSHFCYKYSTGVTVPAAPVAADTCWVAVNAPSPGLTPSQNISFNNFFFQVGFTTGTYNIYGWLKDATGNISTLSNSGTGTTGLDKNSIYYDPGLPPTVTNVISTNTNAPSSPPIQTELTALSGTDIYIKWKLTDDYALPATPVTLFYTTNESTFTQISTNISNSANNGCTVDGTTYTGCYKWTSGSPTSAYFKIRVSATDASGMSSFSSASPNNMNSFKIIAGNTDPGLGGSASSALIFSSLLSGFSDQRTLVVTPDGKFFIRDVNRGVLKIDPSDGKLVSFIPCTGTKTDGAIGVATLNSCYARMILDYQGRLLIYDTNSIRRVNLITNTVSTVIGGGSGSVSGSSATSLAVNCVTTQDVLCPFTALPNGDIYFFRDANSSTGIWKYSAIDGNVYSIIPTGTGVSGTPSMDISPANVTITHFSLEYDTTNSNINKFYANFRQNSCTGCGYSMYSAELNQNTWASTGMGAPSPGGDTTSSTINSMNGKIYAIPSNSTRAIWKLDTSINTWTKIVGGSTTGTCNDGTPATNCNVNLQDGFVTAQGNVFFLDNGLIRTIDENGNVKTLFGQRKTFGDGGLAGSARFNKIISIDESSTGAIGILDSVENIFREISTSTGLITKLIGNGSQSTLVNGSSAVTQSIPGGYWGNDYQIYYDKSNDDIFYTGYNGTNYKIVKYQRSTASVTSVIGGGGTSYQSADGIIGSSISLDGYPLQLVGFDGSKLVGVINQWNGTAHYKNFWKFYDKNDSFRQSNFGGNLNLAGYNYSADGTAVSGADLPIAFGNMNMRGYWDSSSSTWYFGKVGQAYIKSLPIGGNIGTLTTLPRTVISWTMINNASSQKVIYYCSGIKVYKYNTVTAVETAMTWPSSTISCAGNAIFRSATRNSVVFPFIQNGLYGIAEIVDTP